ncbi:MAG: adenylate/guanylate cyclase domain-containing protein [Verrucomicrobiales bacterium]|nr:adenylate/guanylate cyclase domain-containing protein [Verrucomicrobiales bacterium]
MSRPGASRLTPVLVASAAILVVCAARFGPGLVLHRGNDGGVLHHLELLTYDWRMRLGFDADQPAATNLAAIFIDDDDLRLVNDALGFHWPWPRQLFGRLVRELASERADRVGLDVFFLDRHRDFMETRLPDESGNLLSADDFFGRQLKQAGNVLLGCPGEVITNEWRALRPIDPLATNALALGYATADRDEDGVIRRARPFRDDAELGRVWHLGIRLVEDRLGLDLANAVIRPGRLTLPRVDGSPAIDIPLDREGMFYVDWSLAWNDARLFKASFTDVLAMDDYRQSGETNLEAALADHTVVVGSLGTGSNISDVGPTPLEKETYLVSLHWNVANSLLLQRFIKPPAGWLELCCILIMGGVAAVVTWRMRPVISSVVIVMILLGYVGLALWLFGGQRFWLPLVSPLLGALLLTHLTTVTYRVVFERSEQRRVRSVFSKIVSPDVVTDLLARKQLSLRGALRPLTVMFADVRGFTRMTEQQEEQAQAAVRAAGATGAEAEALRESHASRTLEVVNEVLAAIADQVKRHGGTLDKYIGDCVMAFWGAPIPTEAHAAACVRAAIESQRAVASLNAERAQTNRRRETENQGRAARGEAPLMLVPELALGIGINSGTAMVGLMGSEAHIFNYTVFGREVNLASRLESVSGRNRIIISPSTKAELERLDPALAARCRPLPPVQLKGIAGDVEIYEVLWDDQAPVPPRTPEA